MNQKFQKGDYVRVADDLGPMMSHFQSGCDAIVIGSYRDQFGGGGSNEQYTIHIKGSGQHSWYYPSQLTLIEASRIDLLGEWESAAKREADEKGDIDWIFAHGEEVNAKPHGASIATLARELGCDNLWGSRGEGVTYFANASATMRYARPFLAAGDKAGFIEAASGVRAR